MVDFPFLVVVAPSTTPRMGESLTEFVTHPSCYYFSELGTKQVWGSDLGVTIPEGPHLVHVGIQIYVF